LSVVVNCRFLSVCILVVTPFLNLVAQEFEQLPIDDSAQIDSAKGDQFSGWERSALFGYNLSRGNSDNSLFNIRAKINYDGLKDVASFEAETNYGKDEEETNEDSSRASAGYRRLLTKHTFLGFSSLFERDQLAALKYRVSLNPSVGRYLVRTPELRWLVEAGPSYVFEELGDQTDDYLAPRVGQRLEATVTDTTKVFQEVYSTWQSSDNYLLTAQAGIDVAINSFLGLVLTVRNDYDSSPAEDKKNNDFSMISSIRTSF